MTFQVHMFWLTPLVFDWTRCGIGEIGPFLACLVRFHKAKRSTDQNLPTKILFIGHKLHVFISDVKVFFWENLCYCKNEIAEFVNLWQLTLG